MNSTIDQHLLHFVQTHSATGNAVSVKTDLIELEILDSLLLMELVLFVEQNWGVKLIGNDFAPSHFRTVEQLAQLVEDRQLRHSA